MTQIQAQMSESPVSQEFSDEQLQAVDTIMHRYGSKPGSLIPVLADVQHILGYLPKSIQSRIALGLNLPLGEVYGVVTFYSFFTTVPRGRHICRVCLGTACYVRGGKQILDSMVSALKVKAGETTPDRRFSLETVRCLGACGLAPAMVIDNDTHPQIKPARLPDILERYEQVGRSYQEPISRPADWLADRTGRDGPMKRLTVDALNQLHQEMAAFLAVRRQDDYTPGQPSYPYHLMVCGGTACHASRSVEIKNRLDDAIRERGLSDKAIVIETGCNGFCAQGPVMNVFPGGIFYQFLKPDDVIEIIEEHILNGNLVERLMYHDANTGTPIPRFKDIPFFAMQDARVLRNRGRIAAEEVLEYIGTGGYLAAAKALHELTPGAITKEVKDSGLRGRGGAGFPTGLKWEFASMSQGMEKYVLCNADEGDPGAFMDRSVLEADPHAVLEGMIIAAKAIGSRQGYIYCRAEYPLAIKRLNIAIEQAHEYGLLGRNILGSGIDFDLEVYRGAGAFVCGEETALMRSIEGKRGMPRSRPPFPAVQGLWNKPTILNNVETFANIPQIIQNGGKWYASTGTLKSKGTKIFALTGDINHVGLAEVPMGMALGSIIYDIAGGIEKGKRFKAVQLGGPSGGCIPGHLLNTPVDYESIIQAGAIVGSGGMIVMDEDKCVVDVARFFMDFCKEESCGKCTPCRVGTKRMLDILTRICQGDGRDGDIETLEKWAHIMQNSALCGLGQTAPNPVLSTLRYFREEYEAHIRDKKCPAAVCTSLFVTPCQHVCPVEMDIAAYLALIRENRLEDAYRVLLESNPFPSVCGRVCNHRCEDKCRRGAMDEPVNIKYLKRFITDYAKRPAVEPVALTRKEKVAVIGAGPSGMAAARELAYRGYRVIVFDRLPDAGGMLRWGIPAYRLPREILGREIRDIVDLGVELRLNTDVGRDVPWSNVKRDYNAVYLAVGAQGSAKLGVEGEDLPGVDGVIEFLRAVNLGNPPAVGERVAVIGGGNSAVDAARTARRLGAREVTMLYRRLRSDMPAQEEEIHAAAEEGVSLEFLVSPVRFTDQNGRVNQVVCQRMMLGEFDASGRRKPQPIPGEHLIIDVDQVLVAVGQTAELDFLDGDDSVSFKRSGMIAVQPGTRCRISESMMFAGGDVVTGPDTVIGAIAAGVRAAEEIDRCIRTGNGEPVYFRPKVVDFKLPKPVEGELQETTRSTMPELPVKDRIHDFSEVELGINPDLAAFEAARCLRCDYKMDSEGACAD